MSYLLTTGLVVVLGSALFLWMRAKLRAHREAVQEREAAMLAALKAARKVAPVVEGETNADAGLSTNLRGQRGIEVGDAGIDIEALLSSVPSGTVARARAQLDAPTNIDPMTSSQWSSTGMHTSTAGVSTGAFASALPPPPASLELDVPLRNLVLAWYEARGYRPAPAATALRPIDVVLRHSKDPTRTYAFVYEPGRATGPRASSLLGVARSAGLSKLLIAAEHGGDSALRGHRVKGVRMVDWPTIEADLKKLDRALAGHIVGIARRRSGSARLAAAGR